jgi:hypothetical protein
MTRRRRYRLTYAIIAAGLAIAACTMAPSQTSSTGGTGSEVTGVVKYPDSTVNKAYALGKIGASGPVSDAGVFLHPQSFLPDTGSSGATEQPLVRTMADGSFRISNVVPGTHVLYVRDGAGMAIAVPVVAPPESTTIDLGTIFVQPAAGVRIMYEGGSSNDILFYLSIRGTGFSMRGTERGVFVQIGDVPPGVTYSATIRIFRPVARGYDIGSITLQPGQVATLSSIIGQ